jgi:hypothetical protein
MNADNMPIEIIEVLLIEFLFGIGYNEFVRWAHEHKLMHVSTSVVAGVIGTLLIPAVIWFGYELKFWQAGLLLTACFTASGIPMIVGSMKRTVKEKDRKKRRPWPNEAVHARDDAVMELASLAHEIAERSKENKLTLNDLPSYVHRLYQVIGTLKSV